MNEILQSIQQRRSAMAFSPEPIPNEHLIQLFRAAILAPSAYNEQPWLFFVANRGNTSAFESVLNTLAPANQEWAKSAGALVVTAARKNYTRTGESNYYALHDLGMATAMFLVQAQSMGYVTHMMGGFDHISIRSAIKLDDGYQIGAVIALGKPGSIENLNPQNKQRELSPRIRLELEKILRIL
ncbi:nitroreductase family protein [Tenuifilum osseticum]|uniref:nitroreductase family protein n=1 Tax=Tenuifilum osseticum TaxID=3374723 RepID=UPI0034E41F4F